MSGEMMTFTVTVTTKDYEHWPQEMLDEADDCMDGDCDTYQGHVRHVIAEALLDVALDWYDGNPGVLSCEPT